MYLIFNNSLSLQPFMRYLQIIFLGFMLASTFSSCDVYEKVLRGNDFSQKEIYAKKYYNDEDFERASPLLEEIIAYYKGTKDVSEYYYYYAYCYYGQKEYLSASYYFKQFYMSYPQSKYAENGMFMSAYCYYLMTPRYELDQQYTQEAINMLQNYALTYQEGENFKRAIDLMKDLRYKLEKKDTEAGDLYFKTENYKSATTQFENVLKTYPDTKNAAYIKYMICKSKYYTAVYSILSKKAERTSAAIAEIQNYLNNYPASEYEKELEKLNKTLLSIQNKSI